MPLLSRIARHCFSPARQRRESIPRLSLLVRPSSSSAPPIFQLTKPNVFPYDTSREAVDRPVLRDVEWTIGDEDAWAVLSSAASPPKNHLLDVLQGHVRVHPAAAASHPILDTLPRVHQSAEEGGPRKPSVGDIIQFVSFKTTLNRSGEFEDFTARYFHIRDEDKLTVRQHLEESLSADVKEKGGDSILETARLLQIDEFLDLPLVTLSNGQTRRARICRALLTRPELLVLEEPFTGLDSSSRTHLAALLSDLHSSRSPRILLILRPQDPLPSFISHIALVPSTSSPPSVLLGRRDEILAGSEAKELLAAGEAERSALDKRRERRREAARKQSEAPKEEQGQVLVQLNGVNVIYGMSEGEKERVILDKVDWTIREGERWVLAGHNGSGKSTLLSVVLGDHPRSYQEDVTLFGRERYRQATATIQANIGHVSPEISNAFPRKHGQGALTGRDAIHTGWESIFCFRRATPEQEQALDDLISRLSYPPLTAELLDRPFAALPPSFQSLVLFLRALVKNPPLLVLDEAFSGMPGEMVQCVRRFIDEGLNEKTAVVVISHFEEEVPDSVVRLLRLEKGRVVERH